MSFITIPITIEGTSFRNTAVGNDSLSFNQGGVGQGSSNSAFGFNSLMSNTTGNFNTAVGAIALDVNTTGSGNTAVGRGSLGSSVSGDFNTAQGNLALSTNISGSYNAAFGHGSLQNATGGFNTAIGRNAGGQITTGQNNTILGAYNGNQGGLDIRTLNDYVVLSDGNGNPRLYIDAAGLVTAPGGFSGGGGGGALTFNNQTAAYTVVSGDLGKIVNCTAGTFTVSLTAAATLGSGFNCWVWNTGTGVITIDPNGAETIDGVSTLTLRQGEGSQIVCNGTNWETGDRKTMRGYAENIATGSTRPSASGSFSVAVGAQSTASGNSSLSIGYLSSATGISCIALGAGCFASSNYGTAIGINSSNSASQAVTGAGAMALGGSYASGTDSFSAAIGNNTSTYGARGSNSIAIGYLATSTAVNGVSIGTQSNTTATGAIAIGEGAVSTGQYSFSNGYYAVSTIYGKQAYASGRFASSGDAQSGKHVLRIPTTGAAATVLTTNGGAAGTTNQLILSNNSAYAFTGTVVARQQAAGGTQSAAWRVEGLIRREANAGTTTLVASTVTAISNAPGWTLALSADTTNGGLAITATGAAATNIRWVANIDTSEVTYA